MTIIDASLATFDERAGLQELVFFNRLEAFKGVIQHTGDNITGEGDGDDERIVIQMSKLPGKVSFYFFLSIFFVEIYM